jgi:hypothetical protein
MVHHHNTKASRLLLCFDVWSAERPSGIQQASAATKIPTMKTRNIGNALSRAVKRQVIITEERITSGDTAKKSILQ